MSDKSNKKFWDKFAKLYAPFMKKDKGVYDKVCGYINPYLSKDMNGFSVAEMKLVNGGLAPVGVMIAYKK